jgi:predicted amino acid racemase
MKTPSLQIDCNKIAFNAKYLKKFYQTNGIKVVAVLKGVLGNICIAQTLIDQGMTFFGDTNINNMKQLKALSKDVTCMMMRSPALSEIEDVVFYSDMTLISEIEAIYAIDLEAAKQRKIHAIILMIELGDLREGILPSNLIAFVQKIIHLKHIKIVGLGTNYACFNDYLPSDQSMKKLSELTEKVEETFKIKLDWVSGGNSTIYDWVKVSSDHYRINQVRIGESLLCGIDSASHLVIPELKQDAFMLYLEVIEAKQKGKKVLLDTYLNRILLNIGKQDTDIEGFLPVDKIEIVNHSSNHVAAITRDASIHFGSVLGFGLSYNAMMMSMTSPNVNKDYMLCHPMEVIV